MATTAEKIKLLQKRYKLTSRKMAEIVGKSLPSWNNYISGKTTVTREILLTLSENFNVPLEELVGDEGIQISKRGRKPKRDIQELEKEVSDKAEQESGEEIPGEMASKSVSLYFQSISGQSISYEQVLEMVPEGVISIYVKPEEGKAYWTGEGGETGAVQLW